MNQLTESIDGFRWRNVDLLAYKEDGAHFKSISRQVLFPGNEKLPVELRYFEIAPGGHSTLERHEHEHVVMILRGEGEALVGESIVGLKTHDILSVPTNTWHQFRASKGDYLGFQCLVARERDRPHRPEPDELHALLSHPTVGPFIRGNQ